MRTVLLGLLVALCACSDPRAQQAPAPTSGAIFAAGLVEPIGEERVLIPEVGGRLARVLIAEGDTVQQGQLLAEIENRDGTAALAAAEAQVALREAELAKARAGARAEERDAARAALAEADAALALATAELARRRAMQSEKLVSREALDQSQANERAARARRDAAAAQLALLEAGTRVEDLAVADAALAQARAERDRAAAALEKTRIRAPIDGVVLKRDLREGETVVALSPVPLARIGDVSRLVVRADVDELDVSRVRVGQRAVATSDAFPGREFGGTVVRVSGRMGPRNSASENPAARVDTKILEALVELDAGAVLPVGLRMDVRIAPDLR
jgi:HlyD family secretion protein